MLIHCVTFNDAATSDQVVASDAALAAGGGGLTRGSR